MPEIQPISFILDNMWLVFATCLIFVLHLGFATLESGMSRAKNTVNILFKNTLIPAITVLTYGLWGFGIMFPGEAFEGSWFGFSGFGIRETQGSIMMERVPGMDLNIYTKFIFQAMVAATAATIVSGAVVERIRLHSFLLFTLFMTGIIYPVSAMWNWGGGWLQTMDIPFYDFAGSTIVHSAGGWAALAGIILLGPRMGKYQNGKSSPIRGHNMPLATAGIFLIWFGWLGINGGSVMSADFTIIPVVLSNTLIAASAGVAGAFLTSYLITRTHDLTMNINGILAGLVAITAGADLMTSMESAIIGVLAGGIVVVAVIKIDQWKLDDPVGVTSAHLVCGIFGTLMVGVLGDLASFGQFVSQLIGVVAVGGFVFSASLLVFYFIKKTAGLRVSPEVESEGLDIEEHGMEAYVFEPNEEN